MSAATGNRPSDSFGSDAEVFMYDPPAFFDRSYTKQHSIARDRMEELQLAALALRFNQGLEQVAMVSKLAGRQRITQVSEFDDVVPLLFEHTMYKSYPLSLLERQQFDKLTSWVSKLTPIDLSAVDASKCDSIDSWLAVLADKAELQITYTSGTSGTMSFLPVSRHDHRVRARVKRRRISRRSASRHQRWPSTSRSTLLAVRTAGMLLEAMKIEVARGQDAFTHLSPVRPSADLLWLAARLRFAAARGDSARVEVPAALLARRGELEQAQASDPAAVQAWIDGIAGLQGENVLWQVFPADIYQIAAARLDKGERWSFTPESRVVCQGGSKGRALAARLVRHGAKLHRGRAGHTDLWDGRAHGAEPVVQRGPVPHSALGDPVRAGSGDQQASPAPGRADRPVRVFRSGRQQPLGRSHDR